MLTIFASPKPFLDTHTRMIQRNAIRSWLHIVPKPQIILFGEEPGTAEICKELSLVHVPAVLRNELGTPLLNDIFAKAESLAKFDTLCYSNADIILMQDFAGAVEAVKREKPRFLMGGRPWNLDATHELDYSGAWAQRLAAEARRAAALRNEWACDYFVYPRGFWGELPPFAIGRARFDNALLYRARRGGGALVDATASVVAVHQNHSYPSRLGGDSYLSNPEARGNEELAGGPIRLRSWRSATHLLRDGELRINGRGLLNIPDGKLIWFAFLNATRPLRRRLGIGAAHPPRSG